MAKSFWKFEKDNLFFFFFHFFEASDGKKRPLLTRLSGRIDTCKRAWVLVCLYVRTCVSVKADLCVQL